MGRVSWHGQIMAELGDNFIRRMRNWTRAKVAGSSMYYAQMRWDMRAPSSGWHEPPLPVISGEAEDTDEAIHALALPQRTAVMLYWAFETTELAVLARKCGGIDVRTYIVRVKDAHQLLQADLARRTTQWRATHRRNARVHLTRGKMHG